MCYSQAEKMEIIRLVESSERSVKQTLAELDVPRSSFYRWYQRYQAQGYDGLAERKPGPRQFWNHIPQAMRQHVVEVALERPDQSPRQIAWHITDTEQYFISESSVYRILKGFDLVASPAYDIVTASDKFKNPTKRVNDARGQLRCLQSAQSADPLSVADGLHAVQGRGMGLVLSLHHTGRFFTLHSSVASGE